MTSPVDEGILLISSDAFSAGGGFDELAMPRLRAHHLVSLPSVARTYETHARNDGPREGSDRLGPYPRCYNRIRVSIQLRSYRYKRTCRPERVSGDSGCHPVCGVKVLADALRDELIARQTPNKLRSWEY